MVTAAGDRLGNNSPQAKPLKKGEGRNIYTPWFMGTKQVQFQSMRTVPKGIIECVRTEGKNLKKELGDEGIKVLTGPCFGICDVFYCKNTLLLFLSLERDRKLYMEKAENSTYICQLWLQRVVGCLLWVLWYSFRRECFGKVPFPCFIF